MFIISLTFAFLGRRVSLNSELSSFHYQIVLFRLLCVLHIPWLLVLRILVYDLHIEGHYGQSFYFSPASADLAPYTLLFHAAGKTFSSSTHRLFTFLCLDVQRTFFSHGVQQYHQFELWNWFLKIFFFFWIP